MAKNNYRRLNTEELASLEKEFIDFLVVNGITAPDWEQMKEENPENSDQMVELFSEVVFEGIFRKTKFLKISTAKFIYAYQCLADKIVLVGMESEDDSADLTKMDFNNVSAIKNASISLLMTDKKYAKKREYELFEMTQNGCEISDGQLFKSLSLIYMENRNG
ncbi:MAG: DUF6495 family protein [Bacteroidota bacterium]